MKPATAPAPELAGIGARFLAILIDGLLLGVAMGIVFAAVGMVIGGAAGAAGRNQNAVAAIALTSIPLVMLAALVIPWLYEAYFISSPKQATPGKMAMGIVVTDANGTRISFGRATGRYLIKVLISGIFFIGYIVAFFTEKRQALHDIVASTLVVKGKR